jgi:hypothetical protein
MWKEKLQKRMDDVKFNPPASSDDIAVAEATLQVRFPKDLQDLLKEADGIAGLYGVELIWSTKHIGKMNSELRTKPDFKEMYMSFDELLFFGDAGNGDLFAYTILSGAVRHDDIFMWNHENDSRVWIASSLDKYLEQQVN